MSITIPADLIPADVDLCEVDGNAMSIIGAVARGLRRAGNPPELVSAFRTEAMSGDYDHVIATAAAYCD